jgi:excisionase family DNA binding protein
VSRDRSAIDAARDRLAAALAPDVVDALEELIAATVRAELERAAPDGAADPKWLTLREAGRRLGISEDATRMRVKRGRLEARRHGRRLYVSAASVDRLA